MKKAMILLLFTLLGHLAFSQEKKEITTADYTNSKVEMADNFRAEGKIYVVVAVVLTILGGLIVYMIIIDRKVMRLENEMAKRDE